MVLQVNDLTKKELNQAIIAVANRIYGILLNVDELFETINALSGAQLDTLPSGTQDSAGYNVEAQEQIAAFRIALSSISSAIRTQETYVAVLKMKNALR